MDLELTGRSCIRSTMAQLITADSERSSSGRKQRSYRDALVRGVHGRSARKAGRRTFRAKKYRTLSASLRDHPSLEQRPSSGPVATFPRLHFCAHRAARPVARDRSSGSGAAGRVQPSAVSVARGRCQQDDRSAEQRCPRGAVPLPDRGNTSGDPERSAARHDRNPAAPAKQVPGGDLSQSDHALDDSGG